MPSPTRLRKFLDRRLAARAADPSQPSNPLAEVRVSHLVVAVVMVLCWLGGRHAQALAVDEKNDWPAQDGYLPIPPASSARFVSLGYNELAADVAWASTLIYYGSGRIGKSDFRYLERFLDTIIALDPQFHRIYQWAAYAVIFKKSRATQDEYRSSVKYLERAIKEFPNRYKHYWQLGLRYWLDLYPKDDKEKQRNRAHAAYLIERAIHCPDAPAGRLVTLAATMRTQLGQHERARRTLRQMILTTNDPEARKRMELRFRQLVPPDTSKELEAASKRFDAAKQEHLPYAHANTFIIIGARPDPSIDFDKLATPRDLFGTSDADFDYLNAGPQALALPSKEPPSKEPPSKEPPSKEAPSKEAPSKEAPSKQPSVQPDKSKQQ